MAIQTKTKNILSLLPSANTISNSANATNNFPWHQKNSLYIFKRKKKKKNGDKYMSHFRTKFT